MKTTPFFGFCFTSHPHPKHHNQVMIKAKECRPAPNSLHKILPTIMNIKYGLLLLSFSITLDELIPRAFLIYAFFIKEANVDVNIGPKWYIYIKEKMHTASVIVVWQMGLLISFSLASQKSFLLLNICIIGGLCWLGGHFFCSIITCLFHEFLTHLPWPNRIIGIWSNYVT